MLKRYEVNLLETGGIVPPCRSRFKVSADDIEGAAIRASFELGQQRADLIRVVEGYALISWSNESIMCEIVEVGCHT